MCDAGFDVIDVYPVSDAYPNGTLDHAHYEPRAFWDMQTFWRNTKHKITRNLTTTNGKID